MKSMRWLAAAVIIIIIALGVFFLFKKGALSLKSKESGASSISTLLNQAKDAQARGGLYAAKSAYQQLVNEFPNSSEAANWRKKVEELNIKLLFSAEQATGSIIYEIKPGDTIVNIAREFKTTSDLIIKSNSLSGDKIFPGQKVKVQTVPFSILVDKSQNILIVKSNEEIVKIYTASTGINNSTPVGNFKVTNKLVNPTWYKAGAVVSPDSPENILGSRWLGLDRKSYGIHGTTDPQSLGKQVTQGCVRMANADVEELYTYIPVGTEVVIID